MSSDVAAQLARAPNRRADRAREECRRLMARGMRNKEIAAEMGISEDTVEVTRGTSS